MLLMLDILARVLLPRVLKRTGVNIEDPDTQAVVQAVSEAARLDEARSQESDAHIGQIRALQEENKALLAELKSVRVQLETYRRLLRGRLGQQPPP